MINCIQILLVSIFPSFSNSSQCLIHCGIWLQSAWTIPYHLPHLTIRTARRSAKCYKQDPGRKRRAAVTPEMPASQRFEQDGRAQRLEKLVRSMLKSLQRSIILGEVAGWKVMFCLRS
jgi:hypothetical protein